MMFLLYMTTTSVILPDMATTEKVDPHFYEKYLHILDTVD
jgi:hypothetical protein